MRFWEAHTKTGEKREVKPGVPRPFDSEWEPLHTDKDGEWVSEDGTYVILMRAER